MNRDGRDSHDPELQREIRELADAYAAAAQPEDRVAARLEARSRRRNLLAAAGTAMAAVVVVVLAVAGINALVEPRVGVAPEPTDVPDLAGIFVAQEPDAAGRCHAVRLYDTTPTDGRAALWSWEPSGDCTTRSGSLITGAGRAEGIVLPAVDRLDARAGIVIAAAEGVPGALAGLRLVLDPRDNGPAGPMRAYPTVERAVAGSAGSGIAFERVDRLDVPFREE